MIKPEVTKEDMKVIEEYLKRIDSQNNLNKAKDILKEYYEYQLKDNNDKAPEITQSRPEEPKPDEKQEGITRHRI